MNDHTELPSVFPNNCGSSFNFTWKVILRLVALALIACLPYWWALQSGLRVGFSLTWLTVQHTAVKRSKYYSTQKVPNECKIQMQQIKYAKKIYTEKMHILWNFEKPFFCLEYFFANCYNPKMARHWVDTFYSLHYTAGCSQVMYLNLKCSWHSQSEKKYSQS